MSNTWRLVFLACLLLLVLLSAKKIESYDLGFHLKAGSWIIHHHSFPSKDTFTYTQNNQDYLDSHGLFQILVCILQSTLGYSSLTLMTIAVLLLVFLVFVFRMRLAGASSAWICLILLAAIVASERRFIVRPEIFSWFFLGLTLLILEFRGKNRNYLLFLPLIQLLWVNTEGLFILGWVAMLSHGCGGYFQRHKLDKPLLRAMALSLAADFLNPYFFNGVVFPFVLWTRLQNSDLHKQTISEFASVFKSLAFLGSHYDTSIHLFIFLFLALAIFLLSAFTWGKRKFHEIVLSGIFGFLAFTAVRNIPLFILVSAPYLPVMLRDWLQGREESVFQWKSVPIALLILILLLSARVGTNAFYISDRRVDRFGLGLGEMCLPLEAAHFIRENHLDGRILNSLDCGGWMDWQGIQPTFIDGRLEVTSDDFYLDYTNSYKPGGLDPLLARYKPELVLLDYNACAPWVDQLRNSQDWRLIYLDTCSALYAFQNYAPQLPPVTLSNLPNAMGIPIVAGDDMVAAVNQVDSNRVKTWLSGFYKPQIYPLGLSGLGLFTMKYGQYWVAQSLFLKSLEESGGGYEEFYYNLAIASLHLGDFSLGRLCLQDTLQLNPYNQEAREMFKHFSH